MGKEPEDMVLRLLREIRSEIQGQFAEVTQRLDKFESGQKTIRQALSADNDDVETCDG